MPPTLSARRPAASLGTDRTAQLATGQRAEDSNCLSSLTSPSEIS
jgi:hypothetical protein